MFDVPVIESSLWSNTPIAYYGNEPGLLLQEQRPQIEELDAAVGKVFSTLKELGIEKNTIVLFMSDNGGSRGTSMGPLKGGKGSVYELSLIHI